MVKIEFLGGTNNPAKVVDQVARQATMMNPEERESMATADLIKFLYSSPHHSPFEHAYASVRISGASRAFMAQIRTHRHLSFVCSSQHYQDYRDYPMFEPQVGDFTEGFKLCAERAKAFYQIMVDNGVPKEEARYILPESMSVNMIITGNARAWAEMLTLRLCSRNVREMRRIMFSTKQALEKWFPELFSWVGPDCKMHGCREGKMACKTGYVIPEIGE